MVSRIGILTTPKKMANFLFSFSSKTNSVASLIVYFALFLSSQSNFASSNSLRRVLQVDKTEETQRKTSSSNELKPAFNKIPERLLQQSDYRQQLDRMYFDDEERIEESDRPLDWKDVLQSTSISLCHLFFSYIH